MLQLGIKVDQRRQIVLNLGQALRQQPEPVGRRNHDQHQRGIRHHQKRDHRRQRRDSRRHPPPLHPLQERHQRNGDHHRCGERQEKLCPLPQGEGQGEQQPHARRQRDGRQQAIPPPVDFLLFMRGHVTMDPARMSAMCTGSNIASISIHRARNMTKAH